MGVNENDLVIPIEISTAELIAAIESTPSTVLSQSPLARSDSQIPKSQTITPDEIAAQATAVLQSLPPSDQSSTRASSSPAASDKSLIPLTTLHLLLSTILKPLFSSPSSIRPSFSSTSRLTPAGRKNPFPNSASLINTRFSSDTFSLLDESAKPWKFAAPWSTLLLFWVLSQYKPFAPKAKKDALDAHFSLLVPPILTLIDDESTQSKASGCAALERFTNLLQECQSNLLERTGLADVFIDAIVPNMSLLPTLTPEKESMLVLSALYPAFRSVILARWPPKPPSAPDPTTGVSASTNPNPNTRPPLAPRPSKPRQANPNPLTSPPSPSLSALNTLLRHGLIHSFPYTHPNSPHLTSLLLHQLTLTLPLLGIHSARYLKELIPLLSGILTNPFALTAGEQGVEMLRAGVGVLVALVKECEGRFAVAEENGGAEGGEWALEILRACVACWMLVLDDESGHHQHEDLSSKAQTNPSPPRATNTDTETPNIGALKHDLQALVKLLKEAAPQLAAQEHGHLERLVDVEEELAGLLFG